MKDIIIEYIIKELKKISGETPNDSCMIYELIEKLEQFTIFNKKNIKRLIK